ncbi:MAG: translation elongation factor 4 [Firmicutes bacterium]|nr:translation elongation factor 4 [Bacillota bacterium]
MNKRLENIRNFCIVAHIDHGKSTLADRLIEITGTLEKRELTNQVLDSMELERERGITIKLTPTRMKYTSGGTEYLLNLIDTPGHVDFTYEVSRSLAACEGAILIVDAGQGVEAQTLANVYLALENNLEIIPVVNKIDLPSADPKRVKKEVEDLIGIPAMDAPEISAKENINIAAVLEAVIAQVPPPKGDEAAPLKALIFDSYYDSYKGAISMVRIMDGAVKPGNKIKMMQTPGKTFDVVEVGYFSPAPKPCAELKCGEVGYIAASVKNVEDTKVGDTITLADRPCDTALPGYKKVLPVVFSGIFPAGDTKYSDLRDALDKLRLNDSSLNYSVESSAALGQGFRCGFLGLLHMEIIVERLEREFSLEIITTAPGVSYKVYTTTGETLEVSNPSNLPETTRIDRMEEPYVNMQIFTPPEYVGNIMDLAQGRRGESKDITYIDASRVRLDYDMPLNEIIYDFFDSLKSRTRGYASLDYEISGYRPSHLVKLDILLKGEVCDALSVIVHRDRAYERGKAMTEKLKEVIPRQMFEVPIQAVIGGKIIARETVGAVRKDVLSKCYGGDITRKRKLLEKQKEGKKKMRQVGQVEIPSDAFIKVLKSE